MNPKPLSSPDGVVYGYACGHCHAVYCDSFGSFSPKGPRVTRFLEDRARTCCCCRDCGIELRPEKSGVFLCPPCHEKQKRKEEVLQAKRLEAISLYEDNLKKVKDLAAAKALRELMSEISEDTYAAGWLCDLEFYLWEVVEGNPSGSYFDDVDEDKVLALRRLRDLSGGWWIHQSGFGEMFVTVDEFLPYVEDFRSKPRESHRDDV